MRRHSQSTNPGLVVRTLILIRLRVLVEFAFRSIFERQALRDAKKSSRRCRGTKIGKSALVIANGPSASRLDVEKVIIQQATGRLEVFALNWFATSEMANSLVPDYYVLSDPATRFTLTDTRNVSLWKKISAWDSISLILPHSWVGELRDTQFNTVFFDDRELIGWTRNIDLDKPRGYMSMTAFKAIASALYLGFDQIYVIGVDNSMYLTASVDDKNDLFQRPLHYYGERETPQESMNGFYSGGMSDYLYDHARCFWDLKHLFGRPQVINLDPASLTDAFDKSTNGFLIRETE